MLFLAVFCGSLAEYQLEHKIEHDREGQYVESMIADLKEDTAKLSQNIEVKKSRMLAIDSLMSNIYNDVHTDSSLRALYYFVRKYAGARFDVAFTRRTIEQLKHAGGLRLIRNAAVSDSIIMYSEMCDALELQGESMSATQKETMYLGSEIFDLQYVKDYDRTNIDDLLRDTRQPWLLNDDPKLMRQYANRIYYYKAMMGVYLNMSIYHLEKATRMIDFLKKSYCIED